MSGGGHGGGRGGRRRGGGHAEEHENAERWMVTYADMLTLLLVLFIVLYAISAVNVSKFNELKSSLSSAFNGGSSPSVLPGGRGIIAGQPASVTNLQVGPKGPNGGESTTGRPTAQAQAEADNFAKIEKDLKAKLQQAGLADDARFAINQKGLDVTVLTNSVTFTANSSALQPGGEKILSTIVPTLKSVDNQIEVDGNTNQVASAVNGWDLSAARASAVINYLADQGRVAPSRLSGSFFGQYNAYVSPSDPAAINLNRRVDIILLSKYSTADRTGLYTQSGSKTATTAVGATP